MVTVLPVQLSGLRSVLAPAPPRDLAHLLDHGPLLLRAREGASLLLHVALDRMAEVEALAGLRGAQRLRDAAAARVAGVVGERGAVWVSGDAVLVLAQPEPDLAGRVRQCLGQPLRTVDREGLPLVLRPTASTGVVRTATGQTLPELLADASAASREAGRAGGDRVVVCDDACRCTSRRRLHTERLLRRAVPEQRLRLHYQPLVDLGTGRVRGAEALLRLQDDDGALLPPTEVVQVAEETGLVVEVGAWVLREACRQLRRWQDAGGELDSVAVNVSARQLCRDDFADLVLDVLADTGVAAAALVLELTETVLLEAGPVVREQLLRLAAAGVRVGVDDFGTGYASLRYLLDLPVRFVKVDRSFVAGLTDGSAAGAVVKAVLALAADLGLDCIAEGIETAGQLAALQRLGTVQGQGYLLSRPLPADGFAATLLRSLLPDLAVPVP